MYLKQISRNVFIIGCLLILIIKILIRPLHLWEGGKFFLGIAPNLISAFLIPFGAYCFFSGRNFLIARIFKIQTAYDLRLVSLMGFGFLVVNEYMQQFPVFGRTFDYNDIIFSSVGLLIANIVFGKLQKELQQQQAG